MTPIDFPKIRSFVFPSNKILSVLLRKKRVHCVQYYSWNNVCADIKEHTHIFEKQKEVRRAW